MTSGNVSDEPIAYRDDDAPRAAGGDRRPVPRPRPPDRDPHRRLGGAGGACRGRPAAGRSCAARAATSRRALALPGAGTPRPLLACGAELKSTFCVAKGERAWVGHHIGDLRELRDAALVHRRHRPLRAAVRGRARGRRPRPAPRVPLDQVRARARGRRAGRRPAPPRPSGGLPRRARRAGPRRSARSSTAPATGPTGRSGAASSCSATCGRSRGSGTLRGRSAARRRGGDPRAVADGVRVAVRRPPATPRAARRRCAARSTRAPGRRWGGWCRRGRPRR